jgi:hypothetical protein
MLSDRNIRQINREIDRELSDMWHLDHEDKMAAIERVAELRKILEPVPTPEQLVAILDQPTLPQDLTVDLKKIFDHFRR